MSFPDRIERTVDLAQPPAAVWAALTTADGLSAWFGQRASVDLRPGGDLLLGWDDHAEDVRMRVERVEPTTAFGFTWPLADPDEDPRRTYVEFTLEPVGKGTRLRLSESGFAQQPDAANHDAHSEGWTRELGELVDYVGAA